jgi:dihydrolipoamide dehydrogenase
MVYDLLVIGGGPGGGDASQIAARAGLKPILFEKGHLGGVCLNEGCIPSKTLLNCAKRYRHALDSEDYGVTATGVSFDITRAMARKEKIINALRKGSEASKKRLKIPLVREKAEILGARGGVIRVRAGTETHEGTRLLIATGSEAIRPPIPGADQEFVYTNREILSTNTVPARLVIVGGGVIGLEFATFFAEVGSSVTVIEMLPTIAGPLDADVRKVIEGELRKKGVTVHTESKVTAIGNRQVTFESRDGAGATIDADIVLLSVGRRPVVAGFGLENLGVLVERGAIAVDERGRTNVPNVWAAGDVNGKSMLAHTANREVHVCVADMMGERAAVRYENIPSVIYTHPEVATVGLTAEQARERGYDVVEHRMPLTYNGRYLAETNGERGIIKVIAERQYGTVLGVHMAGGSCSEMIHGAAIMIEAELRIRDVRDIVFPHPTVAEMIKDALVDIEL